MIDASGRFSPDGTGGVVLFGDVLTTPPVIVVPPPLPEPPPPTEEGCTDAICGITDAFGRVVSGGWGTSDAGRAWFNAFGSTTLSVDGTRGVLPSGEGAIFPVVSGTTVSMRVAFEMQASGRLLIVASGDSSVEMYADLDQIDVNRESATSHTDTVGFTFAGGAIYHALIEDSDTETRVKVWADGGTEPGSWTVTNSAVTYPAGENYIQPAFRAVTGTCYVDDLDVAGVNRCTEFRFDNFNRTVGSGLGSSDSGGAWTTTVASGTGGASTDGSVAIINAQDTSFFDGQVFNDVAYPAITNLAWEATILFKTPTSIPNGTFHNQYADCWFAWLDPSINSVFYTFTVSSSGSFGQLQIDAEGIGSHIGTFAKTDWLPSTWYLLKAAQDPVAHTAKMKVWAQGDTEPGWQIEITAPDVDLSGSSTLELGVHAFTGSFILSVDWINFDYAGKPCFATGCANVFDDFSGRTVTSTWGRASSSPPFDWNDLGNATTFGVSGGFGYADVTGLLALFETYQDVGNTTLPWSGEFTARLDWAYGSLIAEEYIETAIFVTENTTDQQVECYAYISRITGDPAAVIVKSPGHFTSALIGTPPTAPADVHMKWHFVPGGISEAKVWYNSDPEPGSYQVSFVNAATTLSRDKRLSITSDSASSLVHVTYDQFCFDG